jgi:hypothetical protein
VRIARKKVSDFPFNGHRGLAIQTRAMGSDPAAGARVAKATCDRLRTVVRRGSMPWTRGLQKTETASRGQIAERLKWLSKRRIWATAVIVTVLASLPLYVLFVVSAIADVDERSTAEALRYLAFAQIPIALVAFAVAGRVMPSIELAETTPGRRMLALLGKSGLVSVVTGVGAALAKSRLGL